MSSLPNQLKSCGVVGAGGAGFPTYVKAQSEVEYLLVNGAECEPLLHKDYELMKNCAPGNRGRHEADALRDPRAAYEIWNQDQECRRRDSYSSPLKWHGHGHLIAPRLLSVG